MHLEWLLAGPILRRTEPGQVCVWLATSAPADIRGEVLRLEANRATDVLGKGQAESVRLGERLFVHLVRIAPDDGGRFPTDELLAYDLVVDGERRLRDLGLLDGEHRIAYRDFPLPTFFIRERTERLALLHGSCRKLHAGGEDALGAGDALVHRFAGDVEHRPSALFLTGDQIYADDVAGPLARHLTALGREMLGRADDIPGLPQVEEIPVWGRKELVQERACFTGPFSWNHLIELGEFLAMYVLSWNERNWPEHLPSVGELEVDGRNPLAYRRQHHKQLRALERTRAALPRVRRLLANTPTYMIFDDHDVTDDWNITGSWRTKVERSPSGRRIVANALAAYWAFQGWGNDPERIDGEVRSAVEGYADGSVGADEFEKVMWSFDRWTFVAPSDPPALFLDTRTRRHYDAPEAGSRLIEQDGLRAEAELARQFGHRPGRPLLIVSAVPVCGLEIVERRQRYADLVVGPYAIDFEAWHSNLQGFVDFVQFLRDDLELPWAVLLSGDVHYGFTVDVTVRQDGRSLPLTQLVSSPLHHSGTASRVVLTAMGILSRERHERVGWDHPPELRKESRLRRRILERPSNHDEWNDDSPVFVLPKMAKRVGVVEPPRYLEWRDYAQIDEASTPLVGLNNIGWMSLSGTSLTHRLLARQHGRIRHFTTHVDVARDDSTQDLPEIG